MSNPAFRSPPPVDPDDEPQYDEAVLGRAVRGSLFALLGLALVGGVLFLALHRAPPPSQEHITPLHPPSPPVPSRVEAPDVRFTDITHSAGIRFTHTLDHSDEDILGLLDALVRNVPDFVDDVDITIDLRGDGTTDPPVSHSEHSRRRP